MLRTSAAEEGKKRDPKNRSWRDLLRAARRIEVRSASPAKHSSTRQIRAVEIQSEASFFAFPSAMPCAVDLSVALRAR
jgi:hypothetical protein